MEWNQVVHLIQFCRPNMAKVHLNKFFPIGHSLTDLKRQLKAYGKYVTAVFSRYHGQLSDKDQVDMDDLEVKMGGVNESTRPKLDGQLSSGEEMSTDKLSPDAKGLNNRKWISQLAWLNSVLEPALQLYRQSPPPGDSENGPGPASNRSLVDIATSLHRSTAGMQEWSLGDLTLGLYLLSVRHASEMAVDAIRGEQIFSDHVVEDLIYHVELAKGAYMKNAAGLARISMLRESNVLKFVSTSNLMRPGYYIGVDTRNKLVILGIRGTHTVHDLITDMVSLSNQEVTFDGFMVHFGTVEAARWFLCHEMETLRKCLVKHEGFGLRLVGHSLGGAAASLLAMMLRKKTKEELGFSPDIVSAVGIATPPCVSKKLAESCIDFVTTVVLQDDVIPRMSLASLARLRNEILLTDWANVLQGEEWKGISDLVANTIQALTSVQDAACRYAAFVRMSSRLSNLETGEKTKKETAALEVSSDKRLGHASSDKGHADALSMKDMEPAHEELFAPGTLFHVRGRHVSSIDKKKSTEGRENCTLWKGYPNERFGRIVLSSTMFSDHKCDSHYHALRDVLKSLPRSGDRESSQTRTICKLL